LLEGAVAEKGIRAELSVPLPFKPERPKVAPEVSRSFSGRRNPIKVAEADKMSKIHRGAMLTRHECEMRRTLRGLEGRKGPGMNLVQ
jgi:hypothetical protein